VLVLRLCWIAQIKILGIREFVRQKKGCKRRRQKRKLLGIVPAKIRSIRSETGVKAFFQQKAFYGPTKLHQTDEGSEFKGDYPSAVENAGGQHRFARPYKKNDQAFIENFNRSLRSEC